VKESRIVSRDKAGRSLGNVGTLGDWLRFRGDRITKKESAPLSDRSAPSQQPDRMTDAGQGHSDDSQVNIADLIA
jgi:hypothetical protein